MNTEPKLVCVPSIMHTGRHVLQTIFTRENWKQVGPNPDTHFYPPKPKQDHIIYFHLVDGHSAYYNIAEQYPLVCPMRHPVRVLESFRRRGLTKDYFEEQWRNQIRVHNWRPLYIHIDSTHRDEQLANASRKLGRKLSTNWPVLTVKNTVDFEVTDERLAEIPDFIMDFYTEIQ